eukprot:TRINITY_DN30475_c0_g1_i1.p1 TRINITY_DN30475_c0_g1~~TRINITY_DN30475_c0_g1_i1.p1  ORF type:complete len:265 (+),score=100.25 TRINITY_DN30475_c0_g1_i1:64-795(+)
MASVSMEVPLVGQLSKEGNIWTLVLKASPHPKGGYENRFNPDFCAAFHSALDKVCEKKSGPCALIITSEGKFFSNGLDLGWMQEHSDRAGEVPLVYEALMGRLLTLPVVTVAAVNGHAYAGGFMLALACDYRVAQTTNRANFCMNEVELGMALRPGMQQLLNAKLGISGPELRDTLLAARRWSVAEAVERRFVDEAVPADQLRDAARKLAEKHAKRCRRRGVYGSLKKMLWEDAAVTLLKSKL